MAKSTSRIVRERMSRSRPPVRIVPKPERCEKCGQSFAGHMLVLTEPANRESVKWTAMCPTQEPKPQETPSGG